MNDARETERVLRKKYNFKTRLLLNADRYSILSALNELRETLEAVEIQNVELDLARKRVIQASREKSDFLANMIEIHIT